MDEETRSVKFMVRMRPSVKSAGEKAAKADSRSLASLIEVLLVDHLRATGYLPAPGAKGKRGKP